MSAIRNILVARCAEVWRDRAVHSGEIKRRGMSFDYCTCKIKVDTKKNICQRLRSVLNGTGFCAGCFTMGVLQAGYYIDLFLYGSVIYRASGEVLRNGLPIRWLKSRRSCVFLYQICFSQWLSGRNPAGRSAQKEIAHFLFGFLQIVGYCDVKPLTWSGTQSWIGTK